MRSEQLSPVGSKKYVAERTVCVAQVNEQLALIKHTIAELVIVILIITHTHIVILIVYRLCLFTKGRRISEPALCCWADAINVQ